MSKNLLKGFKKRSGYLERGKPKDGEATLLIRPHTELTQRFLQEIKTSGIRHVIIELDSPEYPDNEHSGTLIIVDVTSSGSKIATEAIIACGAARLEMYDCDLDALQNAVSKAAEKLSSAQIVTKLIREEDKLIIETLYFDEDIFESVTMAVAKAAASYCPKINSVYVYPPVQVDEYVTGAISALLSITDGMSSPQLNEKESFLPLALNRLAARIEISEAIMEE